MNDFSVDHEKELVTAYFSGGKITMKRDYEIVDISAAIEKKEIALTKKLIDSIWTKWH